MVKKLKSRTTEFIKHGMWQADSNSKYRRRLINEIRVFYITFLNYSRHNVTIRSAALTFYTMMAIVPIVAMIFGIAKGFGVDSFITSIMNEYLSDYENVVEKISEFANAYLQRANVGIFAGISVFVILWSVIMVFGSIESAFNYVWDIKKTRSYSRKVSDYLSIIFITPILIVVFNSITVQLEAEVNLITENSKFINSIILFFIGATKYVGSWFIISIFYYILPNTKVKYSATLRASIISGTLFILFSNGYFYFQKELSNFDAVYGGFAAIPLLLIWLNISWQIILFGAELSFAYQNLSKYENEREVSKISKNYRNRLTALVVYIIINNFKENKQPLSSEEIAIKANVPVGAIHEVIDELENSKLLLAIEQKDRTRVYTPAHNINDITIIELFKTINSVGLNSFGDESKEYKNIEKALDSLNSELEKSSKNIRIVDIHKSNGHVTPTNQH